MALEGAAQIPKGNVHVGTDGFMSFSVYEMEKLLDVRVEAFGFSSIKGA